MTIGLSIILKLTSNSVYRLKQAEVMAVKVHVVYSCQRQIGGVCVCGGGGREFEGSHGTPF